MAMGAEQREIRLLFRTMGVNKSITKIKQLGNTVKKTTWQMQRTGKRGPMALKKMSSATIDLRRRFQMWALSVMFFGMLLQRVFMGIAQTAMDTFMKLTDGQTAASASMKRLSVGIEYLKFTLGSAIASVIEPFVPMLMEIIMAITDWIDQHPDLVGWIIILGAALGTALFIIGSLKLAVGGLVMGMGLLLPLALLAAAAFLLFSDFDILEALTNIKKFVEDLWGKLVEFFGVIDWYEIWDNLFTVTSEVIGFLLDWAVDVLNEIIKWAKEADWWKIFEEMFRYTTRVQEFIGNLFGKIFKAILELDWLGLGYAIVKLVLGAFFALPGGIADAIGATAKGFVEGARQFGGGIPETGLYKLHRGEQVVPANQTDIGGINVTVNTTGGVNADEIASIIMDRLRDYTNVQSRF